MQGMALRIRLLGVALLAALPAAAEDCRDLRLTNGKIVTMDARNSTVASVNIHEGRFVDGSARLNPCARTINLRGRTAAPGLIDNHNHIVLLGLRAGHDTRLETAASIADVQALLKARARGVPAGEFITAMGGWNSVQFVEKRLPTIAELDAADTAHPIIVYQSFTGPAAVNTRAKAFFEGKKIAVNDTGTIAANAPSVAALDALRAAQTLADQKRGSMDAMAYSAMVGVTTNVDMGAFVIPGLPDIQDSFTFDNRAAADPFHMYDAFAALHREDKLTTRLRLFFLSMDTQMNIPLLQERLRNMFSNFGDDMMKTSGIGEFA